MIANCAFSAEPDEFEEVDYLVLDEAELTSIMKQIYTPKIFYRRVRTFFKVLKVPEARSPMVVQRFLAIFRSGFWLGIWGKERLQYWQLFLWTLICKPKLLSLAVTLAIYGHHYRRISEKYIFPVSDDEIGLGSKGA